jgi:hypothetical protein
MIWNWRSVQRRRCGSGIIRIHNTTIVVLRKNTMNLRRERTTKMIIPRGSGDQMGLEVLKRIRRSKRKHFYVEEILFNVRNKTKGRRRGGENIKIKR